MTTEIQALPSLSARPPGAQGAQSDDLVAGEALALEARPSSEDFAAIRLAVLALVHDLPEVYVGDTNTARGLSADEAAAKARRERVGWRFDGAALPRQPYPKHDQLVRAA